MKTLTSTQADHPVTQATPGEIFADPVSYLRMLGIEAVLVVEPEALPTAA
jgi:hypothetical protein